MTYEELRELIRSKIYENETGEVTGQILQDVLLTFANCAEDNSGSNSNIAPEYDAEAEYQVGDVCIYEKGLYKCIAETSGEFIPAAWESVTLADLLSDKQSTLTPGANISIEDNVISAEMTEALDINATDDKIVKYIFGDIELPEGYKLYAGDFHAFSKAINVQLDLDNITRVYVKGSMHSGTGDAQSGYLVYAAPPSVDYDTGNNAYRNATFGIGFKNDETSLAPTIPSGPINWETAPNASYYARGTAAIDIKGEVKACGEILNDEKWLRMTGETFDIMDLAGGKMGSFENASEWEAQKHYVFDAYIASVDDFITREIEYKNGKIYVDEVEQTTVSYDETGTSLSEFELRFLSLGVVYRFTVDGQLDIVQCYSNEGKPGFYDLLNQIFYPLIEN